MELKQPYHFKVPIPSKGKVKLLVVLVTCAAVLSLVSYTIHRQITPTADTDLNFDIGPAALFASACDPDPSFVCKVADLGEPPPGEPIFPITDFGESIVQRVGKLSGDGLSACVRQLEDQLNASPNATPTDVPITLPLASCTFVFEYHNDTVHLKYGASTITTSVPAADFDTKYKTLTEVANGKEKYPISGSETSQVDAIVTRTAIKDSAGRVMKYKWAVSNESISDRKGTFSGPITLNLDGEQNLKDSLVDFDDIKIDKDQSYWKITTTGTANANIGVTWHTPYGSSSSGTYTLTKFDFCAKACHMQTSEEQNIVAKKTGVTDNVSGDLSSYLKYTDIYNGTGHGDIPTKTAHWNTDLSINKERIQRWLVDLKQTKKPTSDWVWKGDIKTTALQLPYQNGKVTVDDVVTKDLSFHAPGATQCNQNPDQPPEDNDCSRKSGALHISKNEHSDTMNKKTTLTRTGTFSVDVVGGLPPNNTYSGIYDKDGPLITATNNPPKFSGRLDPLSDAQAQPFMNQYFGKKFNVNGFFTVGYGNPNESVVETAPVRLLPKKILITNGFNAEDSKNFKVAEQVQKIRSAAAKKGTSVLYFPVDTKDLFMNTVRNNGGQGVLLLHLGHGSPIGLEFPEPADDPSDDSDAKEQKEKQRTLPFSQLVMLLEEKRMKGEMIADSCYFGHNPLASDYAGGSLGIGVGLMGDKNGGSFGNVFGMGMHSYQETSDSVIAKVCSLFNI